ncbi:hypothetical protein H6G83_14500 [Anabaena azotica FACHB-119]|uniref:Uncharacterized protein n=1 Tax=Anabaena azotica FACHB-119 TaxID=947527 RepID=A0ABR8D3S5_9NOST|nr:hypothetical protein [Anabaena azotica FACHB-119]
MFHCTDGDNTLDFLYNTRVCSDRQAAPRPAIISQLLVIPKILRYVTNIVLLVTSPSQLILID